MLCARFVLGIHVFFFLSSSDDPKAWCFHAHFTPGKAVSERKSLAQVLEGKTKASRRAVHLQSPPSSLCALLSHFLTVEDMFLWGEWREIS